MKAMLMSMVASLVLVLAPGCSDDDPGTTTDGSVTKQDTGGGTNEAGGKKDTGGGKKDTGTIPAGFKVCQRTCKTVNDCCAKPPCDTGASAMSCDKGNCVFVGCKSVADCPKLQPPVTLVMQCKTYTMFKRTFGVCLPTCSSDADCGAPTKCLTMDVGTVTYKGCGLPCKTDPDCLVPSLKCIKGSYCGVPTNAADPCKADKDCTAQFHPGHPKCDVSSGFCTCTDNQKCQEANKAAGGTWACSTY